MQQVAVLRCAVPRWILVPLYQHAHKFIVVELHELFGKGIVGRTHALRATATIVAQALVDEICPYGWVAQEFCQNVFHVVDFRPVFQHAAEVGILGINGGFVEDVAIEGMSCIQRRHALNLYTRPPKQHGVQVSGFRGHSDLAWLRIVHILTVSFLFKVLPSEKLGASFVDLLAFNDVGTRRVAFLGWNILLQ